MQGTITTAAREYARRPEDERYDSPAAMLAAAEHDRQYSAERTYNTRDLRVVPIDDAGLITTDSSAESRAQSLQLESPRGRASPDDDALTIRLREAGAILGIELIDHVVLGVGGSYYSYKERGRL